MDEFDKIREISEDLTHRREPVFTQLPQKPTTSSVQTGSVQSMAYSSSNQAGAVISNEQSMSSVSHLRGDRQRFLSENVEKPSELNPSFESKISGLNTSFDNAFSAGSDEGKDTSFSFEETPFSAPFRPEPLVSNDFIEEKRSIKQLAKILSPHLEISEKKLVSMLYGLVDIRVLVKGYILHVFILCKIQKRKIKENAVIHKKVRSLKFDLTFFV